MDKIIKKRFSGLFLGGAMLFSTVLSSATPAFAITAMASERPYLAVKQENTLVISGDGALTAEMVDEVVPRNTEQRFRINKIVFDEDSNVTSIGDFALAEFTGLKELMIPETVTDIGIGAFSDNKRLEKVVSYSPAIAKNYDSYTGLGFGVYETGIDYSVTGRFKHKAIYEGIVSSYAVYKGELYNYTPADTSKYNSGWFVGDTKIKTIKMTQNTSMAKQLSSPFYDELSFSLDDSDCESWDDTSYIYKGSNVYLGVCTGMIRYKQHVIAQDTATDVEFFGQGELLAPDGTGEWTTLFLNADVYGDAVKTPDDNTVANGSGNTSQSGSGTGNTSQTTSGSDSGNSSASSGSTQTGNNTGTSSSGSGSGDQSTAPASGNTTGNTTGSASGQTSGSKSGTDSGSTSANSQGNKSEAGQTTPSDTAAKQEAEKKAKEEAEKKAKEEAEKAAKEAAEKAAKEAAEKAALEEAQKKAKEEAEKKAKEEAEKKAKEEAEKKEKEEAEKKAKEEAEKTDSAKQAQEKTGKTNSTESAQKSSSAAKTVTVNTPKGSAKVSGKKITVTVKKTTGAKKYLIQKYVNNKYVTIKTVKKPGSINIKMDSASTAKKVKKIRIVAVNGKVKKYSKAIKVK